jgi:hypothetical protein
VDSPERVVPWGYLRTAGGIRHATRAELAELSTDRGAVLAWNQSYPQSGAPAALPPVDNP